MLIHSKDEISTKFDQKQNKAPQQQSGGSFADFLMAQTKQSSVAPTQKSEDNFGQEAGQPYQPEPVELSTTKGMVTYDLDNYYSGEITPQEGHVNLDEIPLILPSGENVAKLQAHASDRFKKLLAEYNIPEAPASITYDSHGQMVLPQDYPHKQALQNMLDENPGMARELHDVNALSSHYAAMAAVAPMMDELAAAKSDFEREAIMARHPEFGSGFSVAIQLQFDKSGNMQIMGDGKPLELV